MQNEMIRDHIVFGVKSQKIREKLIIAGSELTLEKCLDIAHTLKLGLTQASVIGQQPTQQVNVVSRPCGRGRQRTRGRGAGGRTIRTHGAGGTNRRELTGCRNVVTVAMINTHLRMIVLQKDRHVINVENLTILLKCANLDTLCMNSVRMLPTKI